MTTVDLPVFFHSLGRRDAVRALAAAFALLSMLAWPALAQTGAPTAPADNSAAGAIVEVAPRPALTFDGQSPWDDGYTAILNAFQRLKAETERAGLKPVGHPIAVFLFTDDAGFRFRAMIPLAKISAETSADPALGAEFALGKTPSGQAVKFEHRGAYDEIDATYEAITAWLDDRNLLAEDFFAEEWVSEGTGVGDVEVAVDVYVFVKTK